MIMSILPDDNNNEMKNQTKYHLKPSTYDANDTCFTYTCTWSY